MKKTFQLRAMFTILATVSIANPAQGQDSIEQSRSDAAALQADISKAYRVTRKLDEITSIPITDNQFEVLKNSALLYDCGNVQLPEWKIIFQACYLRSNGDEVFYSFGSESSFAAGYRLKDGKRLEVEGKRFGKGIGR
jgi:hypothetical protein